MGKKLELVKSVSVDEDFKRQLNDIKNFTVKIWENIKLSWYTNHDHRHSESIIDLIGQVLQPISTTDQKLSELELFILLSAAYLHDIGMQHLKDTEKAIDTLTEEDYDYIRKWHPQKSFEIITSKFKTLERDDIHFPDIDDQYLPAIAKVSKGHGTDFFDGVIKGFKDNPETPDNEEIRCELLTALLMLGDELDLHGSRVDFEQLRLYNPSSYSLTHWYKHHYVDLVKVKKGVVHINLKFPDMSDEIKAIIQDEIKQKLEKQIKKVNPIFREQADGIFSLHECIKFKLLKDDTEIKRLMPDAVLKEFRKARSMKKPGKVKRPPSKVSPKKKKTGPKESANKPQKVSIALQAQTIENINTLLDEKHVKPLQESLAHRLKENKTSKNNNESDIGEKLIDLGVLGAIRALTLAVRDCFQMLKAQGSRRDVIVDIWERSVDILGWIVLLSVNYNFKGLKQVKKGGKPTGIAIEIPVLTTAGIEIVYSGHMHSPAKLTINEARDAVHGQNNIKWPPVETGWEDDDVLQNLKKELYKMIYRTNDDPGLIDENKTITLNTRIQLKNQDNAHIYITIPGDKLSGESNKEQLITSLKRELPALHTVVITLGTDDANNTVFIVSEPELEGYLLEFFENKPE